MTTCLIKYNVTRQIWGIWKLRPAYSPETPNLGQNRWCFFPCDLEIWWMTLENNRASFLCCSELCVTFHSHRWIQTWVTVRKHPIWVKIWRMTLKNNRAPLLCYFKLYASFRSHRWIQAGVTVRKRLIWVKIDDFFSRVTFQLHIWPWKTIRHLLNGTSSFVHHFVAIGDFKLELQSGNAQFGSNLTIFRALWPCNLTYDLEKTIGHLFYSTSSFVHHFVNIGVLKLELQTGNAQFGPNSTIFRAVWPWNVTDDLQKQ